MKKQITAFFMAWGMFCALPCPYPHWDDDARGWMMVYLPLVGLIMGVLWALVMWAFSLLGFTGALAAAILTAAPYLLTGFLHLDGYMDCCDAILSRRDLPERQRILKDSHVGSFAVICVALLFLVGFAALRDLDFSNSFLALPFLMAASRCAAALCLGALPPMRTSQYAGSFQKNKNRAQRRAQIIMLALVLLASGALGYFVRPGAFASVLLTAVSCALLCLAASKNLGGMSGDISGFSITLSELFGLILLSITGGISWFF